MGTSHTWPSDPKLGTACNTGIRQLVYQHIHIKDKQKPDTRQTQVLITNFILGRIQNRGSFESRFTTAIVKTSSQYENENISLPQTHIRF